MATETPPNPRPESRPTALPRRAPLGPIATTTWKAFLRMGEYDFAGVSILEKSSPCIRSLRALNRTRHTISERTVGRAVLATQGLLELDKTHEEFGFPYPENFRPVRVRPVVSDAGEASDSFGDIPGPERAQPLAPPAVPSRMDTFKQHIQIKKDAWSWSVSTRWFGISHASELRYQTHSEPLYIVVGIFPRGCSNPHEHVVFIRNPSWLFWELRWAAFRRRGIVSALFSLRRVSRFRLYKCNPERGTHERVHLNGDGVADLQLLLKAYRSFHVRRHITLAWAQWIHETLNYGSRDVLQPVYSLEFVLGWSPVRITIVVLLPVLLSLGIGLWINSSDWTDLTTIQTAWGTASYVVTAGSLAAALLGILSSITDN